MSDASFDSIASFIEKGFGVPREKVTLTSRIEEDFGITGDDADDFILQYSEKFGVDISKFPMSRYFHGEGAGWYPLWRLFGVTLPPKKDRCLTVVDLCRGYDLGRLE